MLQRARIVPILEIPISIKVPESAWVTLAVGRMGDKSRWQVRGGHLKIALRQHFAVSRSPIEASFGAASPVFARWTARDRRVEEERQDA